MENEEIRKRLLAVAAQLLEHRPSVYRAFEDDLQHGMGGAILLASVLRADPYIRRIYVDNCLPWNDEAAWYPDPESEREVRGLLFEAVERWIRDNADRFGHERPAVSPPPNSPARESKADRQARRYQQCIDAGLEIPRDPYRPMPPGIARIAKAEGVSRQAYTADVKAHRDYLNDKGGR